MYIKAIVFTLAAWFAGLVLDANTGSGDMLGFMCFRILFPLLAMGLCILNRIEKLRSAKDK